MRAAERLQRRSDADQKNGTYFVGSALFPPHTISTAYVQSLKFIEGVAKYWFLVTEADQIPLKSRRSARPALILIRCLPSLPSCAAFFCKYMRKRTSADNLLQGDPCSFAMLRHAVSP